VTTEFYSLHMQQATSGMCCSVCCHYYDVGNFWSSSWNGQKKGHLMKQTFINGV